MGLFTKKEPEKSILIVTVESGSVRLGIALLRPKVRPVIVYQTIEPVDLMETLSHERLSTNTLAALERAAERVVKEGLPHIASRRIHKGIFDEIHYIYGSPWHFSHTRTVSLREEKPFVVTKKFLEHVALEQTQAMVKESFSKLAVSSESLTVIERHITDIKLNGYLLREPYGKTTNTLELTLFTSVIPEDFKQRADAAVGRFFSSKTLRYHSLPLMLFSGIRDTIGVEKDFMCVIVGGEVTDILMAKDEELVDVASFPLGENGMFRTAGGRLGTPLTEARSTFSDSYRAHLSEPTLRKTMGAIDQSVSEWQSLLTETVTTAAWSGMLPRTVFLSADTTRGVILRTLASGEYARLMHPSAEAAVVPLSGDQLRPFCLVSGTIKQPDGILALSAVYLHGVIFAP